MQIYIKRNNEEFGPYSQEAVKEYIKHGLFQASDFASYVGTSDWKPLSELLGIKDTSKPSKASKSKSMPPAAPASGRAKTSSKPFTDSPVSRPAPRRSGLMIVLNILLVAAVVAGIYVRFGGKGPIVRRYLNAIAEAISKVSSETAQPSPTPAKPVASLPLKAPTPAAQPPSASSTPAPAVVAATPEPVVAATPAPAPAAPKPFDPADLAASPNAWPKKVRLKQAVIFSALYNGQVVGSVQADAGTPVDLVSIAGDQVTVSFNGSPQTLQWKLTDLEEEAVKRGWGVPAATPAPVPTPVIAAPPAATAPPAENAVPAAPAPAVESAVPAATPAPTENTTPAANPPATENVPPPSTENPPPPGQ